MMALTKRAIDALKYNPKGRPVQILWDGTLPGFGVRIFPSGAKSFVLDYRSNGRKRRITLGKCGVLTPVQARKKALKELVGITDGADPAEDRRKQRAAKTVKDFTKTYIEDHAKPHKKSWTEDQRRIKKYVVPALGSRSLHAVTRGDVARLHRKI